MSTHSIPAARFGERITNAQSRLPENDASALLIGVGPELQWLTGYAAHALERLTMLVIPLRGRASLIVPDGYRFLRVDGTVRANDEQQVAQADIRKLALRYYQSEEHVQRSVDATWAKQHRITYRMPVGHVYSSGF